MVEIVAVGAGIGVHGDLVRRTLCCLGTSAAALSAASALWLMHRHNKIG